ncbi:hypothetical protein FYJ85_11155 [Victivallaceae bacterium BBE-744-WT-12]|uniref:Uncharacterized protein n=1 Tax=Victivallis lenta TaxID=2606640 RepID=A0A844G3W8_9BACT|nr:hypothetical protein [Victivallis lenta]MST97595.1 hypothetical protein [Victivallis lenta]
MRHSSEDFAIADVIDDWNRRWIDPALTARIAELEAERDRLREALQEIISCQPEMCLARYCCRKCESMAGIARKALKGAGE